MAAPAFAGSASITSNAASTTYTGNTPASAAVGEVMLAQIVVRTASVITFSTIPTGWTQIANDSGTTSCQVSLFWKPVGAGEAGPYNWVGDQSNANKVTVCRVSGADTTTFYEDVQLNTAAATTALAWNAVTTLDVDRLIVCLIGATSSSTPTISSPSGGLTQFYRNGSGSGTTITWAAGLSVAQAVAGSSGTFSATASGSEAFVAHTLAIIPPAPPPVVQQVVVPETFQPIAFY